jgi:hypothetical protein
MMIMVDQVELKPCLEAELCHWFFQKLNPEQRKGFLFAAGVTPRTCDLTLGMQHKAIERIAAALSAYNPNERLMPSEAFLERAWVWFLDANPDDVTSPEEYPDHALVTFKQLVGIVKEAAITEAEERGETAVPERLREALEAVDVLKKQRLTLLAAVYAEAPTFIAKICDETLDPSGVLLGEVRALAREALSHKGVDHDRFWLA